MAAEHDLWRLARRQHGVLATQQLAAAGVSHAGLSRLVARGWLRPVHRGVYLVGPIHGPRARLMAATLALGEDAVLSHRAAAELWGFGPALPGAVAVTVVAREARPRDGIRVHRTRRLDPAEIVFHDGIPVTTPDRTLLDQATQLAPRDLARAVEEAELLRLLDRDWLDRLLARSPSSRVERGRTAGW